MEDKWPNQRYLKDKPCRRCGNIFTPTGPCSHYCSDLCREEGSRHRYLKRYYGLSLDEYNSMLEKQNHKCAICLGEGFLMKEHYKMKLVVDHCHEGGQVRGLLCHNCNRGLGLFKDDPESLLRGVEYLKEGSETIRKE